MFDNFGGLSNATFYVITHIYEQGTIEIKKKSTFIRCDFFENQIDLNHMKCMVFYKTVLVGPPGQLILEKISRKTTRFPMYSFVVKKIIDSSTLHNFYEFWCATLSHYSRRMIFYIRALTLLISFRDGPKDSNQSSHHRRIQTNPPPIIVRRQIVVIICSTILF